MIYVSTWIYVLLSSPLFQDPTCHSRGLGQMHPLALCMHPEWQGEIYIMLSKWLTSLYSPVKRAKLRENEVVQTVSAITQCFEKIFNSKLGHIPGSNEIVHDYF